MLLHPAKVLAALVVVGTAGADEKAATDLAAKLRELDGRVLSTEKAGRLGEAPAREIRDRLRTAHQREAKAFAAVKTRADWERFRDIRIRALRESLGPFPPPPKDLKVRVTRRLEGDGYRVE